MRFVIPRDHHVGTIRDIGIDSWHLARRDVCWGNEIGIDALYGPLPDAERERLLEEQASLNLRYRESIRARCTCRALLRRTFTLDLWRRMRP